MNKNRQKLVELKAEKNRTVLGQMPHKMIKEKKQQKSQNLLYCQTSRGMTLQQVLQNQYSSPVRVRFKVREKEKKKKKNCYRKERKKTHTLYYRFVHLFFFSLIHFRFRCDQRQKKREREEEKERMGRRERKREMIEIGRLTGINNR